MTPSSLDFLGSDLYQLLHSNLGCIKQVAFVKHIFFFFHIWIHLFIHKPNKRGFILCTPSFCSTRGEAMVYFDLPQTCNRLTLHSLSRFRAVLCLVQSYIVNQALSLVFVFSWYKSGFSLHFHRNLDMFLVKNYL